MKKHVKLFVSIPFDEDFLVTYYKGIVPACRKTADYDVLPVRLDTVPANQAAIKDNVLASIDDSDLLLADVSRESGSNSPNPSVMLEIGYAMARGMPCILIGREDSFDPLPANLQGSFIIAYRLDNIGSLELELAKQIKESLDNDRKLSVRGSFLAHCLVNRREAQLEYLISKARTRIQIVTLDLEYIQQHLLGPLKEALSNNEDNYAFRIEILTLDPNINITAERGILLGLTQADWRTKLKAHLDFVRREIGSNVKVSIYEYSFLPTQITFIIDNVVISSIMSVVQKARENIHFVINTDEPSVTQTFLTNFDTLRALTRVTLAMNQNRNSLNPGDARLAASRIVSEILALPVQNTESVRAVRRKYSRMLNRADSAFVLELAMELINSHNQRWLAYELIRYHKGAFREIGEAELGELGQGMSSWDEVDSFARTLSGPAWMNGQVTDNLIHKWVRSDDLWWRRAALVSTVAWNTISQGGRGDLPRTLAVCRMLLHDREDMVDKAMSWALRELVRFDSDGLCAFMREHDAELSSRVKREVRNKLTTGLKNPKTA